MSNPNSFKIKSLFSASLSVALMGTPLAAQTNHFEGSKENLLNIIEIEFEGFVGDDGAANRIVASEHLRTLSEEIPAAVCHLHNNVDVEEAAGVLELSVNAFDFMTDALLNGNEVAGIIGAEERRKTIVEIEALLAFWQPVRTAALAVLADSSNAAATEIVYLSEEEMFEKTYTLLTHIEAEYSNPTEILQSDLMLIEVSGRMAAFSQRLAFEACRVWSGRGSAEMAADLLKTMGSFEASLTALSEGLPTMSILPPPNAEIAGKLAEISDHWGEIHESLTHVASGADIPEREREELYHNLVKKLHQIEELEDLYQEYAKRIY